jgi:hypothetical protein
MRPLQQHAGVAGLQEQTRMRGESLCQSVALIQKQSKLLVLMLLLLHTSSSAASRIAATLSYC